MSFWVFLLNKCFGSMNLGAGTAFVVALFAFFAFIAFTAFIEAGTAFIAFIGWMELTLLQTSLRRKGFNLVECMFKRQTLTK
jgi:hypothetical protein